MLRIRTEGCTRNQRLGAGSILFLNEQLHKPKQVLLSRLFKTRRDAMLFKHRSRSSTAGGNV